MPQSLSMWPVTERAAELRHPQLQAVSLDHRLLDHRPLDRRVSHHTRQPEAATAAAEPPSPRARPVAMFPATDQRSSAAGTSGRSVARSAGSTEPTRSRLLPTGGTPARMIRTEATAVNRIGYRQAGRSVRRSTEARRFPTDRAGRPAGQEATVTRAALPGCMVTVKSPLRPVMWPALPGVKVPSRATVAPWIAMPVAEVSELPVRCRTLPTVPVPRCTRTVTGVAETGSLSTTTTRVFPSLPRTA